MNRLLLIPITALLVSCASDEGTGIVAECVPDDSNKLVGCWQYEKCYPSKEVPGHSRRTGVALNANGEVVTNFTQDYEVADCSGGENGGGQVTFPGTYTVHDDFINSNGLDVTEFRYISNSGITKTTYYYFDNERLCFPVNTFMGDYDENDLTKFFDSVEYNELGVQLNLDECFVRVNFVLVL